MSNLESPRVEEVKAESERSSARRFGTGWNREWTHSLGRMNLTGGIGLGQPAITINFYGRPIVPTTVQKDPAVMLPYARVDGALGSVGQGITYKDADCVCERFAAHRVIPFSVEGVLEM